MSNYTKTTDFEAKDSLPTGDSGKIIRGAEFETEFDAVSTAIATKADTAGPTFTGTLTFATISDGTIGVTAFVDEDNMSSNSATLVPTQQSVKAYVDAQVTAQDLDFQADSGGALSIDLDSEALTFTGGTGVDTSGSGNAVTFAIDSTVATLTGTQTLTNKTLTSPDVNTPDIDGGTIDGTVIGGATPAAVSATTVSATGNITVGGTVDGRDVATDGTKLDGIEASATADQTAAEIRTLVGSASDSNVFTDADHSKLDGIEASATADQTAAEIRTLVESASDSNVFTDADHTKLNAIEASADVTDTANVTSAGALMDSELASIADVKALDQSVVSGATPTFTTTNFTDATNKRLMTDAQETKLDSVESSATADQTDAEIRAAVEAATDSNVFTDADHTKLNAIEASADVTDTANVTAAGALMDSELTSIASVKALNQGVATTDSPTFAGLTTTADVSFGDNDKAIFGAGSDLQIYHDGSNSYIDDAGTGDLLIRAENNLFLKRTNSDETYLSGAVNGAVTLFHNNNAKLETTISGIQVTGNISNSSGDLTLDVAGDIILDADGGDIFFVDAGVTYGKFSNASSSLQIKSEVSDADIIFKGNDGGTPFTALTLDMSDGGEAYFSKNIHATSAFLTTANNDPQLTLISTDADASVGPRLDLYRNSSSPANGDVIGEIQFQGKDSVGSTNVFATISSKADQVDNGAEDGSLRFKTLHNGTLAERITIAQNNHVIINEAGADADFRVESNGNANMLFVDGGNNRIGVGTGSPEEQFSVQDGSGGIVFLGRTSGSTTGLLGRIEMGNTDVDSAMGGIDFTQDGATNNSRIGFFTQAEGGVATERMRIASDGSLSTPTSGTSNVRFGVNAGNSITSGGNYNVVVGDEAGTAITTGDANVAVGFEALKTEDAHGTAVAVGFQALNALNAGVDSYNTAVGTQAGVSVTTGIENTFIGGLAGDALADADYNVAVGSQALSSDTLGSRNTAIGRAALFSQNFTSATDSYNTGVGYGAGSAITTGVDNTLIGGLAGDAITDADYNVALGNSALSANTVGSKNTAIGSSALLVMNPASAADTLNTAVGYHAGRLVSTGTYNTLLGGLSGNALTTGANNTILGANSGMALVTGGQCTFVGEEAGQNATGGDNTFVGAFAGENYSGGANNTSLGRAALLGVNGSSTGSYNTAIGYNSGLAVTTGGENTIVGALAADAMTTGSSNTFIGNTAAGTGVVTGDSNTAVGKSAGLNITSGGNNLFLGHDAGITGSPGGNQTTGNGSIALGDENIGDAYIQVDWTVASDARDKTDFTALDLGLDFVKDLQPVTYKWDKRAKYGDKYAEDYDLNAQTPDGTHKEDWLDIGFKAQEVEALEIAAGYNKDNNTNLVSSHSDDGKQMGLQYSKFVPILVKAIQEQQALIDALTARIETLEG